MTLSHSSPIFTPDGRYLIVNGRLWRTTDPNLDAEVKTRLVGELMSARRAVAHAKRTEDSNALRRARAAVQLAKLGLGERDPSGGRMAPLITTVAC